MAATVLHGPIRGHHARDMMRDFGFLTFAIAVFAVPVILALARDVWSIEQGSQGPVILASGLWLLYREARGVSPVPGRGWVTAALLVPSLAVAAVSRPLGMLWLQWVSCLGAILAVYHAYAGDAAVRRLWFPLAYLLFLMPPPQSIAVMLTDGLKKWIAQAAVELLAGAHYEVARSGTMIYIDQYELLVADACAGLNSIFSLMAVGLFYIYVRWKADWRYSLILAILLLPIAIAANLARVIALMLATHYFGDGAAQAYVHQPAGFFMFAVALGTMIGVDMLLAPIRRRLSAS